MIQPNIIRGGKAIPFNYNLFLMKGRKHSQGGIDVGKDLEVEGGEVMQTSPNEVRVFSAQKFLGGESPANLVLKGANPNKIFAMQEQYKQINGINDDGTKKKAKNGLIKRFLNWIGNKGKNSPVDGDSLNFNGLKLTNGRGYTPEYLDSIYRGLIKRGMHKNQVITVTGTAAEESGGDVYATSDDNEYTGILQWAGNRYKIKYPDDREKELNSQLDYIYDTLMNAEKRKKEGYNDDWTDGGKGSGYNSWKDAYKDFNDTTNVYNMTRGLNTGYVRPTGAIKGNNGSIINRMNATKQIFENNGMTDLLYEPNKKKFGGMNNKQYNAQVLGYVPFTGRQRFASGGRKQAGLGTTVIYTDGTKHNTNDKDYDESKVDASATDIYHGKRKLDITHWATTGIGAGSKLISGITGAIINNATNKKYLSQIEGLISKMKAYNIPLTKLKTNYNINPQLAEIDNALMIGKKDIDANTASSQVALARKRAAQLNASLQKNKLYGQKENIETNLSNKDKLQQYQTIAENIKNTQNIENQKLQMLASIVEKRAENATSTIQNIVGATKGSVDTILKGTNQYEELLTGLEKSPNGSNAVYGQIGKTTNWRKKAYNKKDNNDQS